MREIKFRAWDKKSNTMLNDVPVRKGGKCAVSLEDRFELMQYTGLKDKNGKEIYEGDIVNFVNFGEEVNLPIQWFWNGYNFHNTSGWDITNHEPEKEFEIIGNIYENPELIK